jgi:putative ABC transport system permease protein
MGTSVGEAIRNPLWRKSLLLLLRYPEILLALIVSAAILAIAAGSGSLFLSSASSAALREEALKVEPATAGVTVREDVNTATEQETTARDSALRAALGSEPALGPPVTTLLTDVMKVVNPTSSKPSLSGRLITRTDAFGRVELIDGGGTDGVWVSDYHARELGLRPGDQVVLQATGFRSTAGIFGYKTRGRAPARVAGIYRILAASPPTDYWQPLYEYIYSPTGNAVLPPFVIAPRALFYELNSRIRLGGQVSNVATTQWEYPLETEGLTLSKARRLASKLDVIGHELEAEAEGVFVLNPRTRDENGEASRFAPFSFPSTNTVLPDLIEGARETVGGIAAPVRLMSLAGVGIALVMIAAAAAFSVRRRRAEALLLSARGIGAGAFAVKAALEAIGPIGAGAAIGWLASIPLLKALGPGDVLDEGVAVRALWQVVVVSVIAVVLVAVVATVAEHREGEVAGPRTLTRVKAWWWTALLWVLAAIAYGVLLSGSLAPVSTEGDGASVDVVVLIFPIVMIAAGAITAAQVLVRVLPSLKGAGSRLSTPLYLALRRLAAANRIALALVASSALAIGVLIYAGAMVASVEATAQAKASVSTGSDVAGVLQIGARVPDDLPFPTTEVDRLEDVSLAESEIPVELLIVDTGSLPDAVHWEADFAASSLDDLVTTIKAPREGALPVIAVGREGGGDAATLQLFTAEVPLEIVARASAFPGMNAEGATLIASSSAVGRLPEDQRATLEGASKVHEVWARGDPSQIVDALNDRNVAMIAVHTAEEARATPGLRAAAWTFSYLQAVAVGGGLIVIAGMLLYLQARQRAGILSFALARRMGLRSRAFRVSVAVEVGVMLLASLVIGTGLSLIAVFLVYKRFDILPSLPPDPLFRVPVITFALAAVGLIAAAAVAGRVTERRARSANVAENLRLAE